MRLRWGDVTGVVADITPAISDVASVGPFFAICTDVGECGDHAWRPLVDLYADGDLLRARIAHVGGQLGTAEERVAASLAFQALAARLVAPPLALAAVHGVLPALPAVELCWRPTAHRAVAAARRELRCPVAAPTSPPRPPRSPPSWSSSRCWRRWWRPCAGSPGCREAALGQRGVLAGRRRDRARRRAAGRRRACPVDRAPRARAGPAGRQLVGTSRSRTAGSAAVLLPLLPHAGRRPVRRLPVRGPSGALTDGRPPRSQHESGRP